MGGRRIDRLVHYAIFFFCSFFGFHFTFILCVCMDKNGSLEFHSRMIVAVLKDALNGSGRFMAASRVGARLIMRKGSNWRENISFGSNSTHCFREGSFDSFSFS